MRRAPFVEGAYYHIYNRGVDKRNVFSDPHDLNRFFTSMLVFNTEKPVGSIFEMKGASKKTSFGCLTPKEERLVDVVCYCLNPNHFHFILTQLKDGGISEFMKRLGGGYTNYFNERFKRTGALFQGTFKSKLINSNEYLLHVSAYVNLNNKVHRWDGGLETITRSSWNEYKKESGENFCEKEIILGQFKTRGGYEDFATASLRDIIRRKQEEKELQSLLID